MQVLRQCLREDGNRDWEERSQQKPNERERNRVSNHARCCPNTDLQADCERGVQEDHSLFANP